MLAPSTTVTVSGHEQRRQGSEAVASLRGGYCRQAPSPTQIERSVPEEENVWKPPTLSRQ